MLFNEFHLIIRFAVYCLYFSFVAPYLLILHFCLCRNLDFFIIKSFNDVLYQINVMRQTAKIVDLIENDRNCNFYPAANEIFDWWKIIS